MSERVGSAAQRSLDLPSTPSSQAPLVIRACGQQWIWRYEYPDGTYSYYELVVPVDTAVILHLCSTDVVHRWWVPGLQIGYAESFVHQLADYMVAMEKGGGIDFIAVAAINRGGTNNLIAPHMGVSKNAVGLAVTSYLVEVAKENWSFGSGIAFQPASMERRAMA